MSLKKRSKNVVLPREICRWSKSSNGRRYFDFEGWTWSEPEASTVESVDKQILTKFLAEISVRDLVLERRMLLLESSVQLPKCNQNLWVDEIVFKHGFPIGILQLTNSVNIKTPCSEFIEQLKNWSIVTPGAHSIIFNKYVYDSPILSVIASFCAILYSNKTVLLALPTLWTMRNLYKELKTAFGSIFRIVAQSNLIKETAYSSCALLLCEYQAASYVLTKLMLDQGVGHFTESALELINNESEAISDQLQLSIQNESLFSVISMVTVLITPVSHQIVELDALLSLLNLVNTLNSAAINLGRTPLSLFILSNGSSWCFRVMHSCIPITFGNFDEIFLKKYYEFTVDTKNTIKIHTENIWIALSEEQLFQNYFGITKPDDVAEFVRPSSLSLFFKVLSVTLPNFKTTVVHCANRNWASALHARVLDYFDRLSQMENSLIEDENDIEKPNFVLLHGLLTEDQRKSAIETLDSRNWNIVFCTAACLKYLRARADLLIVRGLPQNLSTTHLLLDVLINQVSSAAIYFVDKNERITQVHDLISDGKNMDLLQVFRSANLRRTLVRVLAIERVSESSKLLDTVGRLCFGDSSWNNDELQLKQSISQLELLNYSSIICTDNMFLDFFNHAHQMIAYNFCCFSCFERYSKQLMDEFQWFKNLYNISAQEYAAAFDELVTTVSMDDTLERINRLIERTKFSLTSRSIKHSTKIVFNSLTIAAAILDWPLWACRNLFRYLLKFTHQGVPSQHCILLEMLIIDPSYITDFSHFTKIDNWLTHWSENTSIKNQVLEYFEINSEIIQFILSRGVLLQKVFAQLRSNSDAQQISSLFMEHIALLIESYIRLGLAAIFECTTGSNFRIMNERALEVLQIKCYFSDEFSLVKFQIQCLNNAAKVVKVVKLIGLTQFSDILESLVLKSCNKKSKDKNIDDFLECISDLKLSEAQALINAGFETPLEVASCDSLQYFVDSLISLYKRSLTTDKLVSKPAARLYLIYESCCIKSNMFKIYDINDFMRCCDFFFLKNKS